MTQSLAIPTLSDEQLRLRIKIARSAGYGLEGASAEQLHIVYLLAQRYRLDPLIHITLYRGRPWVTIDGRAELARRHPQFRGLSTEPLSKEQKLAWGYREDDLVVQCTVHTRDWGDITARGKVTADEMRAKAPTGSHPSEMAEKRAIARAARLAFGQSAYLDEDEVEDDRQDQAKLSARYKEIFVDQEEEQATSQARAAAIVEQAHAAAAERDGDLDAIEYERQQRLEGVK